MRLICPSKCTAYVYIHIVHQDSSPLLQICCVFHRRDTTKPPEKGVKYVCCGGCRQWLMAPRDAVYVVCSTCEAINNCNLVPKVRASNALYMYCGALYCVVLFVFDAGLV